MRKPNLRPLWLKVRPALLRAVSVAMWGVAWLLAGLLVALLVMAQRGPLSVFLYIVCTGLGLFMCSLLYELHVLLKAYVLGTIAGVK